MELVGYSECYSPCLHPLGMHVTVVTMLTQIHQTLKLRRRRKALGWLAGVGLEESHSPSLPLHPPAGQSPLCWDRDDAGLQYPSMTCQLSLWMPLLRGSRHHGLLLLGLLNAKAAMATE